VLSKFLKMVKYNKKRRIKARKRMNKNNLVPKVEFVTNNKSNNNKNCLFHQVEILEKVNLED
jgi:hypothetical protein